MTRRFTAQEAESAFSSVLSRVWDLKQRKVLGHVPEFWKWRRDAEAAISRTYGDDSQWLKNFQGIPFRLDDPGMEQHAPWVWENHEKLFANAVALLESMKDEASQEVENDRRQERVAEATPSGKPPVYSNRVFVVHGRDEGLRETVARFLDKLGLIPVILNEQAHQGRPLIQKLGDHGDVGFAVVLLTPDDVGKLAGSAEPEEARARQNVIFELGYFVGRIELKRMCVLVGEGIKQPSDITGIGYVELDSKGAWRQGLIRELLKAKYDLKLQEAF